MDRASKLPRLNRVMAEPNIITWNPANWITVVLMVALAFFIVGAFAKIWKQKKAASAGA